MHDFQIQKICCKNYLVLDKLKRVWYSEQKFKRFKFIVRKLPVEMGGENRKNSVGILE